MFSPNAIHWLEKSILATRAKVYIIWASPVNVLVVSLVDNLLFHINQYGTFNPIFIYVCTG